MNRKFLYWTALIVIVVDQLSKGIVVHLLNLKTIGSIEVLPPYLNFRMAWNRGVNFGMFSSNAEQTKWLLIAIALAISAWVAFWILRENVRRTGMVAAGLLIGGAIGNVIDRLIYGAVADFLNMSCCGVDNPFAFNIADIAIFAGAFGLIFFTGQKKSA